MDSEVGLILPVLLVRGLSDLAMYPLMFMSVIMQGSQPYSTLPRQGEAIESRICTQRGGKPGRGWKIGPPCVQVYRDIFQSGHSGFRSQYKGFLIYNALYLCQTYSYFIAKPKDWWGYCKVYTLNVLGILALKPLKTAHTRFVLQSSEAPAYRSLWHYFSTVTLREMYQGLPYTLAKELMLALHASHNFGLGILLSVGYPLTLAETRMEAMSSHRGLQSYRNTNRTILGKILTEEGIFGLYRGIFTFGLYVRLT